MAKYQFIIDKIRTIYGKPTGYIPLHAPVFAGNEKNYLLECIDTTFVSSVGKFVDLFERRIEDYTKCSRSVVCVNGTNALHLALKLVGVTPGDEVITQPLTFIATVNAICYCNAIPVFLDVDKDTLGLSPDSLTAFIKSGTRYENGRLINRKTGRRIKACLPMHTFGHPCRIEEISIICKENGIELVEDAAESIGSSYKGIHTGNFGTIGVLSFNGNKTITTGGGGMLMFSDKTMGDRAKHLTTQAKLAHPWEFNHDDIGYNYRMPNINAALGVAQMEMLDVYLQSKRNLAKTYSEFFRGTSESFFHEPENCVSNYWLNVIMFSSKAERDLFLEESNSQGIMTRPVWKLMNKLPMFENCQTDSLENSRWLEDRIVNIPSSVVSV